MPTTEYTQRYGIYQSTVFNDVIPVLKFISINSEAKLKFPVMKVLKAIAKKLLLNVYEALHLACNLSKDWLYQDSFFSQNSKQIRDIVFYRRPEDDYQSILLFLLMEITTIKIKLNDNFRIYTAELQSTLPNFRVILNEFMNKFPVKQPSPKQLNQMSKMIIQTQNTSDYQDMVDNIMHLCPTYRAGGQQQCVNSCANTFTNKKQFSQYNTNNTNTNTIREVKKVNMKSKQKIFQLMSQMSELQRPILQQDQFNRQDDFFGFDYEDYYNHRIYEI